MKNIRQVLIDKIGLVRIKRAEAGGDPKAIAKAKERFEGLTLDEVEIQSTQLENDYSGRYTGKFKLIGRDGFEFTQNWCAGNPSEVMKRIGRYIEVNNLNDILGVITPAMYYIEDMATFLIVIRAGLTLEQFNEMIDCTHDDGDATIMEKHVLFSNEIEDGTIPLKTLELNERGIVTDGTGVVAKIQYHTDKKTEPMDIELGKIPGNPSAKCTLVFGYANTPECTKYFDRGVVEFVGTFHADDADYLTLSKEGVGTLELDTANELGKEIDVILNVGLKLDGRVNLGEIQYYNEHWRFNEEVPKLILDNKGLELTLTAESDFTETLWGVEGVKTGVTAINDVTNETLEFPFKENQVTLMLPKAPKDSKWELFTIFAPCDVSPTVHTINVGEYTPGVIPQTIVLKDRRIDRDKGIYYEFVVEGTVEGMPQELVDQEITSVSKDYTTELTTEGTLHKMFLDYVVSRNTSRTKTFTFKCGDAVLTDSVTWDKIPVELKDPNALGFIAKSDDVVIPVKLEFVYADGAIYNPTRVTVVNDRGDSFVGTLEGNIFNVDLTAIPKVAPGIFVRKDIYTFTAPHFKGTKSVEWLETKTDEALLVEESTVTEPAAKEDPEQ